MHRKSTKNNPALEQSLANAAATMYNVKPAALKQYAYHRAEAMILPRHEGDNQTKPTDWDVVTDMLVTSWQSLHKAIQRSKGRTF